MKNPKAVELAKILNYDVDEILNEMTDEEIDDSLKTFQIIIEILNSEGVPHEKILQCEDYDEMIELLLQYCDNAETKYPNL